MLMYFLRESRQHVFDKKVKELLLGWFSWGGWVEFSQVVMEQTFVPGQQGWGGLGGAQELWAVQLDEEVVFIYHYYYYYSNN